MAAAVAAQTEPDSVPRVICSCCRKAVKAYYMIWNAKLGKRERSNNVGKYYNRDKVCKSGCQKKFRMCATKVLRHAGADGKIPQARLAPDFARVVETARVDVYRSHSAVARKNRWTPNDVRVVEFFGVEKLREVLKLAPVIEDAYGVSGDGFDHAPDTRLIDRLFSLEKELVGKCEELDLSVPVMLRGPSSPSRRQAVVTLVQTGARVEDGRVQPIALSLQLPTHRSSTSSSHAAKGASGSTTGTDVTTCKSGEAKRDGTAGGGGGPFDDVDAAYSCPVVPPGTYSVHITPQAHPIRNREAVALFAAVEVGTCRRVLEPGLGQGQVPIGKSLLGKWLRGAVTKVQWERRKPETHTIAFAPFVVARGDDVRLLVFACEWGRLKDACSGVSEDRAVQVLSDPRCGVMQCHRARGQPAAVVEADADAGMPAPASTLDTTPASAPARPMVTPEVDSGVAIGAAALAS